MSNVKSMRVDPRSCSSPRSCRCSPAAATAARPAKPPPSCPRTSPSTSRSTPSFEGDQWRAAAELLGTLPRRRGALDELLAEAAEEAGLDGDAELQDALGPEIAFAVLSEPVRPGQEPPVVMLTQPGDPRRLRAALGGERRGPSRRGGRAGRSSPTTRRCSTSYREALDGPSLEDSDAFAEAMDDLPGDALAARVRERRGAREALPELPAGLQSAPLGAARREPTPTIGAALRAEGDGLRVEGRARSRRRAAGARDRGRTRPSSPTEVPADAIAFLSFNDLGAALDRTLDMLGGERGAFMRFAWRGRVAALAGRLRVYVSPETGRDARHPGRRRGGRAARRSMRSLRLAGEKTCRSSYDAFDGLLAVSSSEKELAALRGGRPSPRPGRPLRGGTRRRRDARRDDRLRLRRRAGRRAASRALRSTTAARASDEYLEPLGSAVFWSRASDDAQRFSLFLGID